MTVHGGDAALAPSDGSVRRGPWIVFWTGFKSLTDVSPLVEEVAKLPATLEDSR